MSLTAGNLFISSYNNQDFESSTNFSINLAVPVTKAKRLRLLGATIPNLFMPFGPNDCTFKYYAGTSLSDSTSHPYTITFPTDSRWADITSFCAAFQALILAAGGTVNARITVSYNSTKNVLVLTSSTTTDVIQVPGWNWNVSSTNNNIAQNANFRIGFTQGTTVVSTSGVLTATGFPNIFQRTNSLYITTNISTDSNNDANIGNILGRIPVTIGWGGVISYENPHSDFASPVFCANIKEVRIKVLDEDYQELQNPDNAYLSLVIGIEY